MKKMIYPKLLGGYLLFGILGFLIVSTLTAHFSYQYIKKEEISKLYKEANLISSDYAISYYSDTITLEDFKQRLKALNIYLSAKIWVIDMNGNILVNSASKAESTEMETISNFHIGNFKNWYYQTGYFYNYFSEEHLSVYAPISVNYKVKGYIIIHKPVQELVSYNNGFLTIAYITLAVLFLCAFV